MAAGTSLEPGPAGQQYYKICQESLCCLVRLTGDLGPGGLQEIKVGVFRGLHTVAGQYFMEVCLLTNIPATANIKISMAGLVLTIIIPCQKQSSHRMKRNISGTFSSGDVYPQAGRCRETRVAGDGLFSVEIMKNCTETIAIMARRYDLD